ncbi:MAG: PKD domain-containing protein, partial [Bacteroidota bacterium]
MNKIITSLFVALFLSLGATAQDFVLEDGVTENTCEGSFYDNGGADGPLEITDDEVVYTICPDGDDLRVILDFVSFAIQDSSGNTFEIYDGDSPDPEDLIGEFLGTSLAGAGLDDPIIASDANESGCLTIVMDINFSPSAFDFGWEAAISCQEPCQIIDSEIVSINPLDMDGDQLTVPFSTEITFTGGAEFSDDNSDGAIYEWDFGDGNTATGQVATHIYSSLGEYTVTLTVTDANGCENVENQQQDLEVVFETAGPSTGCPYVSSDIITNDVNFDCYNGEPETVDLQADFLQTGETDQYRVESIPYAPPFPYEGLSNPISVNTDDVWSPTIQLPFDFCFFGDVQTEIKVGSNGVISFQNPGGGNGWSLSDTDAIPNNSNNTISEGNIMMTHDMNPAVTASNPDIAWEILGDAPCRTFVVSFKDVTHFGGECGSFSTTFMMVLYETTNAIDFYIEDKPTCLDWNDGLVALGIQNDAGDQGYSPPGRNIGDWSASNEAWRFIPDGEPNFEFQWYGPGGAPFSTSPTINVPVNDGDSYTAEIIYTNCNGDVITETSTSDIDIEFAFEVETEEEIFLCEEETEEIITEIIPNEDDEDFDESVLEYEWYLDGEIIDGESSESLEVSDEGVYEVVVTNPNDDSEEDCFNTSTTLVTVYDRPYIDDELLEDIEQCGDFTYTQEFDLTVNDVESVSDADTDYVEASYYLTETDADNDENAITNPDAYVMPDGIDEQTI